MNTIKTVLENIGKQNENKLYNAYTKTLLKAILAGMFIGIGGTVSIKVVTYGKIFSAFTFTIGFVLIITLGVELFTSNNLLTLNLLERKAKVSKILKNWSLVWVGNLIGTLFIALLDYFAQTFNGDDLHYVEYLIEHKTHLGFVEAIFLGIGCNIIIVLTTLLVNASKEYVGKVLVSIFGVMVFLLSGYEHIIANMFYFNVALLHFESVSIIDIILNNMIPVTIGNIIGGGIIIPLLFHYTFKK